MSRAGEASTDDATSKLLDAMNSFHVENEFTSKFKAPSDKYSKFTPKSLMRKLATIERNSSTCVRDVRFLIKFYLHMTSNSRSDVTSEGYEESAKLMKKYQVEKKANRDNITLHRIAASFPIVSVSLLRQFKIDRRFTTAMLESKDAGEFPWCMRTQMCLSLVPTGQQYVNDPDHHNLIFGIVAFMYYENKVVNASKKDFSPTAVFEIVLNIGHAIYKDSSVDEQDKIHAWNHVVYDYTANKASVDGLLKHFRKEISEAEATVKNRFGFSMQNRNHVCSVRPNARTQK